MAASDSANHCISSDPTRRLYHVMLPICARMRGLPPTAVQSKDRCIKIHKHKFRSCALINFRHSHSIITRVRYKCINMQHFCSYHFIGLEFYSLVDNGMQNYLRLTNLAPHHSRKSIGPHPLPSTDSPVNRHTHSVNPQHPILSSNSSIQDRMRNFLNIERHKPQGRWLSKDTIAVGVHLLDCTCCIVYTPGF